MKKTFKIFAVMAALFCTVTLTGCADLFNTLKKNLLSTETWCEKTISYSGQSVNCYFYYADNGYTNDDLRTDVTMPGGLTVVFQPESEAAASEIFGINNAVVVHTFAKGESIRLTKDGATEERTLPINDTTWTVFNKTTLTPCTKNEHPTCLSKNVKGAYTVYKDLDDIKDKFDVTRILANLVYDYLE